MKKLSELNQNEWRSLSRYIDSDLFESEKFSATKENGYYYLSSNQCDSSSLVKVYGENEIEKVVRIGEDTETWQDVHEETLLRLRERFSQF